MDVIDRSGGNTPQALSRPHAIIDGGGESSEVLLAALEQVLAAMAAGQVVLVISHHPESRIDIPLWCWNAGHTVLARTVNGSCLQVLLKKTAGTEEG